MSRISLDCRTLGRGRFEVSEYWRVNLASARLWCSCGGPPAGAGGERENDEGDGETIYSRVGHGLGLEMPEPPSLSPSDPTALRSGEVLCIEPNLDIDGVGWFVSEEELVVRDGGFELLSPPFPRDLRVIG